MEAQRNPDVMTREDVLAALDNQEGAVCCLPLCKETNRVVPTQMHPQDSEFFTFKSNRKIRIIKMAPTSPGRVSDWQSDTRTLEETLSDEEDYWFENAAPNRLPVIQPPPPTQINRIINKFEPRSQPNMSSKSLEDDLISPGRLPRKNFNTGNLEDTDDYEDESNVSMSVETASAATTTTTDYALSSVINSTSGMIIEITAESTDKIKRNSPPVHASSLFRSKSMESSPMSTRSITPITVTDGGMDSLSSQRSRTPPATPSRSPELADDSCHPSPEVPHRTVCAVPDPVDSQPDISTSSNIIVTGSNLGGIANPGFSPDDQPKPSEECLSDTEVDAGYKRVRVLDSETPDASLHSNHFTQAVTAPQKLPETLTQSELPILFFLHGVGGSADIWNSQLRYFVSKGYQVIAPDMLGHGFSSCPDKPSAYTFTQLFKDFVTIFDAYVPDDKKCIVIGHSYGCSFSAALARTRPEKIVSLIMIASGGPTPLAPPPNLSNYPGWIMNIFRFVLECKFRNQQHKYNPRGKTIKFKEAFDVPSYVFKYVMLGQVWPEGDAGFHRRITVPTLLVYGMRDTLISLVEECEMERTIPKAYLELIPMAGHCVMLETPDQLNSMMFKFIKKWTAEVQTSTI